MKFDTLIRGGTIVTPTGCEGGSLAIRDGKIAALLERGVSADAAEVIDAGGKFLLPGAIDTHSHFFDPGPSHREGVFCGTKAAAAGGYTTVMSMPNTDPAVENEETFNIKLNAFTGKSHVDFVLWASSMPGMTGEIDRLHKLGAPAFKAFTLDAGPAFRHSGSMAIYENMEAIKRVGAIFAAHAEDGDIVAGLRAKNEHLPWSLSLHNESRPWYAELSAIANVLVLAKASGCPVHICHMSIPEGAEMIRQARQNGVDVTIETCPHYLTLNVEDTASVGTYALICPPIRDKERMNRLWDYIADGTIDYIGTDHAPYLEEDKEPENLWDAAGGAPCIDMAVPLMLMHGVKKRGLSLSYMSRLLSTNAAKRFGLHPRKGELMEGADADIMLVDMESDWTHTRADSFSKTKLTRFAYEGLRLTCQVERTLVRGKTVFHGGEISGGPVGRLVTGR